MVGRGSWVVNCGRGLQVAGCRLRAAGSCRKWRVAGSGEWRMLRWAGRWGKEVPVRGFEDLRNPVGLRLMVDA